MPEIEATTEPVRVPAPKVTTVAVHGLRPEHVELAPDDGHGLVLAFGPVDVFVDSTADVVAIAWRLIAEADRLNGTGSTYAADIAADAAIDETLDRLAAINEALDRPDLVLQPPTGPTVSEPDR
jgi:hypothetical protein